jgi:PKD repeat protein
MSGPLGDFDLVLQVSGGSLQRMFKAMHTAGTFRHIYTGCYEDRFVTTVIGAPTIALDGPIHSDGTVRATASARLLYHSRAAADAKDVGHTAVADVAARVRLGLTNQGDPALMANAALAIDWTETAASDITVTTTAGSAVEAEIVETLLELVGENAVWNYPLPQLGFGAQSVQNGSFRFLNAGGTSAVAAGLNLSNVIKGSRGQLQSIFVSSDWAVGIGASFLTSQLSAALSAQLGALPAPHGTGRPTLSDATICVVPNPFDFGPRCLASARERVFLDFLDWTFAEGRISFSGAFSQVSDSIFIPPISASFQFDGVPSLSSDGTIAVTFTQPTVQLQQWYAVFVNVLTGGAIATAVSGAIASALASVKGPGGSGLIDLNAISQFASFGSTVQLPLAIGLQSAQMHSYGMVVQGTLNVGPTSRAPVAAFQVLPASTGPTSVIFNAQSSWSPGGLLASYHWDFGDGTQETSAGTSQRFVTSHNYAAGTYQACLTVTDAQGVSVATCHGVTPGVASVVRLNASSSTEGTWAVCRTNTTHALSYLITANGAPVSGATMTLSAPGWQASATSGANGVISFPSIQESHFNVPIQVNALFATGCMNVALTVPGFPSTTHVLMLIDCAAAAALNNILHELGDYAQQLPHDVLDPLGPVMAKHGVVSSDPSDPVAILIRDTVLTSEWLMKSVQLLHTTSDTQLAATLLGASAKSSAVELAGQVQKAATQAAKSLGTRAKGLMKTTAAHAAVGGKAERSTGTGAQSKVPALHTRLPGTSAHGIVKNVR